MKISNVEQTAEQSVTPSPISGIALDPANRFKPGLSQWHRPTERIVKSRDE